jgi:vanillate/3-O-methylgallate O-demethylase
MSDFSVNDFSRFAVGQSKHVIHTNEAGKVIHEGILTKFADDDFVLHGRGGFWMAYQLERGDYDASVEREDWFIYQVSGPNAVKVLAKLDHSGGYLDTKYMWVSPITIAGHAIWALRQGMAGEIGFELQGPRKIGDEIYAAVLDAGTEFGIRQMGARVAAINHLEACYPTIATDYLPAIFEPGYQEYLRYFLASMPANSQPAYIAGSFQGQQISDYYRSPVELGWGKVITAGHEFLGREAVLAEKASPRRVIRTLVWNADDIIDVYASLFRRGDNYTYMEMPRDQWGYMWADRVEADGRLVGVTTSRGYSYYFRQMLSLCPIDVQYAEPGTEVTVAWGNPGAPEKRIRATVAPAPYKADHRRLDLRAAL